MKNALVAAMLFVSINTYAIGHAVDGGQVLPLQIAKSGPTRLSLMGERISDLFFYPEEAAHVVLHHSGNVFIVPQEGHTHLYATVMGERGLLQDLKLIFKNKKVASIELRMIPQKEENKNHGNPEKGKKYA